MRKKSFPAYPTGQIRNRTAKILLLVIVAVYVAFTAIRDKREQEEYYDIFQTASHYFAAYFIDVGQGDATLLVAPNGKSMLIDCGPTAEADYLIKYMNDVGVTELEYLILTHPHEDHYGGAVKVLKHFPVEKFLVQGDSTDIYPYDRLIYMAQHNRFDCDTEILGAHRDDRFIFADAAEFRILSPEAIDKDDANESSLAIKLIYGDTAFLFTGDAEKNAENTMLANGYNVKADVFSAGHHGSSTSNSDGFIQAVSPKYAVISCAKDNSYGHPHKQVLKTFQKYGVTVLRTDELSSILLLSDGKNVVYYDETEPYASGTSNERSAA